VGAGQVLYALVKAVAWQSVTEYYWHRAMHLPPLYRALHKYHHHYKSPRPFDDLFIHPVEAAGYYCILYSPAFVVGRMPVAAFLMYMAVMGVCGVLDHCGVHVDTPVYSTRFHDAHHALTRVNFAFPFPLMDLIHGTFAV
jgi:sterol desaturase/sphingolipid hydroxylase (fatty acid hydroxylase superfamily)